MPYPSGEEIITMLTILLCLVQVLVPNFGAYLVAVEIRAVLFAVGLFAFLLSRLWLDSRVRSERSAAPR
jgi:hypothetical protein